MREAFALEYGISVGWIDDRSTNTTENAMHAACPLSGEGGCRVILVMQGFDFMRATRRFEATGLQVITAPRQSPRWTRLAGADFLPNAGTLLASLLGPCEYLAPGRDLLLRLAPGPACP